MKTTLLLLAALTAASFAQDAMEQEVTQGALRVKRPDGQIVECPLKHTDVKAEVTGFIARVKVTQTFFNPYPDKIEAVYVFPLPHTAAVDDMTMVIGERKIVGVIKRRAEARQIYNQALAQGMTASLLEQERPNIFTQSVGNIKPQQEIRIEISYVDVLKYDMGTYEFHFPMVVGPRYIPGGATGKSGTGWAPDTDRVPDASRITPPVLKPGQRNGHDISLSVKVDAGVPVHDVKIVNHKAQMERGTPTQIFAALDDADSIPNKDFVLKYAVVGEKPALAVLANSKGPGDGYFMLMVQPRLDDSLAKAPPREMVFLVDVSGSMSGEPTAKVRQTMAEFFKLSKPDDTVQVVTFAGQAGKLFEKAVPATPENVKKALEFTNAIEGGGGTEMLKGIKMALEEPADPQRVRIVVMLTDGFIGNEKEIIDEVGRKCGDRIRFWCLGIGSAPNRFLIDGVAKQGGGMSGVIELKTDPTELVRQCVERIHRAQLAKIEVDWQGLPVFATYPRRVPELWAGRPVILFGRYRHGANARVTFSGVAEGQPLSYSLDVGLPAVELGHDVLPQVWARKKIEDLGDQSDEPEIIEEITQTALDYRLMSQFTSFVAVDESERGNLFEQPTPPRRIAIPVPMPEGVSYEGVFGGEDLAEAYDAAAATPAPGVHFIRPAPGTRGNAAAVTPAPGVHYGGALKKESLARGWGGYAAAGKMMPMSPTPAAVGAGYLGVRADPAKPFTNQPTPGHRLWSVTDVGRIPSQANTGWHEFAKQSLAATNDLTKLQYGLLLEKAFLAGNPWNNDGTDAKLTDLIEKFSDRRRQALTKDNPALARKLDLVFKRRSVEEAVGEIAKAAGLKVEIVPGSLTDAAELLSVPELRIAYLDLRRTTAAQALDWLLTPMRLTWEVTGKDAIRIDTARRLAGNSVWVYQVGDLALPTKAELGNTNQTQKAEAALKEFEKRVGADGKNVILLSPYHLLVLGDAALHAQVTGKLDAQKKGDRWTSRAEDRAKRAAALAEQRATEVLARYPWHLVAGINVDEAQAELAEIWDTPATKAILAGDRAELVLRAAWALKQPLPVPAKATPLTALYTAKAKPSDAELIAALREHKLTGEDAIVLAGIAAQARGGKIWQAFREELPGLVRDQHLSGPAVVLLNRLGMRP
jgi:Ca-activated chloride channel family protein